MDVVFANNQAKSTIFAGFRSVNMFQENPARRRDEEERRRATGYDYITTVY